MRRLKQGPALVLGLALAMSAARAGDTSTSSDGYQRITLDQFMREALVTQVPLSFEIPQDFAAVDVPRKRPPTAAWIERRYLEETLRTGRMPRGAALFRGSLSFTVVFDANGGRFICGKLSCEATQRDELAQAGYRVLAVEKRQVGTLPIILLSAEAIAANREGARKIYQAFIPLQAGSGVVHLVYRPATSEENLSERIWQHFRDSLAATTSPPLGSASSR